MKYQILGCQDKSKDWKVLSIKGEDGTTLNDVSVNRVNKKNEPFPNFDEIKEGNMVEGNHWQSGAGKSYLFAPDAPKTGYTPRGGTGIAKAQERKAEYIKEAQDRKSESIAYFNSINTAVAILGEIGEMSVEEYHQRLLMHRDRLIKEWLKYEALPF
jgi:hypothetical protein